MLQNFCSKSNYLFQSNLRTKYKMAKQLINQPFRSGSCQSDAARIDLRFVQFRRKNDARTRLGLVSENGENLIELSSNTCVSNEMCSFIRQYMSPGELREKSQSLHCEKVTDDIALLSPLLNPQKIICVGLNYRGHCEEQKVEIPKEPIFFSKFASSIIGPRDSIIAHPITEKIDWEVELAVIIGKDAKCIPKEKAMDYVFGYSVAQDISARDWQKERNGGQFLIGKSMDTFCPLGPSIVHKSLIIDPHNLNLSCHVNGQLKQKSNTKDMIFRIDDLISRLSHFMTLKAGDVLLTGTPPGVGFSRNPPEYLKPDDVIDTDIQCIGKLINKVVNQSDDSRIDLRFVQFRRKNDARTRLGLVSENGENLIELSSNTCVSNEMCNFIREYTNVDELREKTQSLHSEKVTDDIKFLAPVLNPQKIICVGLNYRGHCEEQKREVPKEPIFFSKFASSIIGPRDSIIAHPITEKIDWEVELAVIIGKDAKCIPKEKAMDYVFGYCVAQDISARDWQKERNGGQFLIGKSMDTFCPLGPSIVHKSLIMDPHNLNLSCHVNGQLKQNSNTKDLVFRIDDLISRLSHFMTLKPGDVLLTGTPSGVGCSRNPPEYLKPGDVVETEIQCLGKLSNKVVKC